MDYILSERIWEDTKENILNPMIESYAEYADPIEKFRKDPLFVLLDAVTLLNAGGHAVGKIGKTIGSQRMADFAEISVSKRLGRATVNKALNSHLAEIAGLDSWAERMRLATVGKNIKTMVGNKAIATQVDDANKIISAIEGRFSGEEIGMFHRAIKGIMNPKYFDDIPGGEEAMRFYKNLTNSNKEQLLKYGILNEQIFERRSILPSMEVIRRMLTREDLGGDVPPAMVEKLKGILRKSVGDKELETVFTRLAKEGYATIDNYLTPEAVVKLKDAGLSSGYITDITNTVIRGTDDILTRADLPVFMKAKGKNALNVIKDEKTLLQTMVKQQTLVNKQIYEMKAVNELLDYAQKTTDRFGNPLAYKLETADDMLAAIKDKKLVVAPGKNRFNRMAGKASRDIVMGIERGEDIGATALKAINKLLATNDLPASQMALGESVYAVNKDLAKAFSAIPERFTRTKADKFFRSTVDPIHRFWKGIILGLNPGFAVRTAGDNILRTVFAGADEGVRLAFKEGWRDAVPSYVRQGNFVRSEQEFIAHGKNIAMPSAQPLGKLYDHLTNDTVKRSLTNVSGFFDGIKNIQNKTFNFVAKTEDFFRDAVWLDKAAKASRSDFMKTMGRDFYNLDEMLTHITLLEKGNKLGTATKAVSDWFYNYNANLSQFEKQWVRRIVPFWSFYRQSLSLSGKVIRDMPGKLNLINNLSKAVQDAQQFEGAPDWIAKGGVFIGDSPTDRSKKLFFSARGINPFIAVDELASSLSDGRRGSGTILSMLSPLVKVPIEQLTGRELFGRRKRFTSPWVQEDPFTNKLFYMDKYSGEMSEIGRVTPAVLEHFARQVPQYRLIQDMMYPYYRYGTSTIFSSEYLEPKKEKPRVWTAAKFAGFSLSELDMEKYTKSFKEQMLRSRKMLESRLLRTGGEGFGSLLPSLR
jgi:hypothetical protein